jgi:capsular exopolysaccharide synthesis family protein
MQIIRKNTVEKDSNIFADVVFRYLPYWPLFILLLAISVGGGWVYMHYATPLYETTARILIKDEKKGAEESKAIESLDRISTKKIIENELEVIKSRTILNDVVKRLHLYAPVYEEKSYKNISAYTTSPIKIEAKDVNAIKETRKVYFVFNDQTSDVTINSKRYPLNSWQVTPYGELKFIKNKRKDGTAGSDKLFFSLAKPKTVATSIETGLKVSSGSKLSTILNLSYVDESQARGEDIVNELLAVYNLSGLQDKNTLATNTLTFIEDRLYSVEHELDSIEHKIQQYKSQSDAIDIGTQGKLFLENVSSNDQKLSEINMQLAVLNQVENYVYSKNKGSGIVPSTLGVNDLTLTKLVDNLYSAELEYESLKKTTGDNNPVLVSLTDKIEKIKPSIVENIQSQRNSLQASRVNLASTNNLYSSALKGMPKKERDLIDINREHGIKNEIYTFLLQKREETALSFASTVSDSRIVDKAEASDKPVSPKRTVVYLSSFLLSMFLGFGIIFCKETFSRKIMFRHEIENLTDSPIIGEISSENSKDPIVIAEDKKTFISEQFRKLRATLNYIGINSKHKRILVTSAVSGEGKSFIATNLALTLAIAGKRVALLDFDLNNPSLNNKLNLGDHKGITDYLLGECQIEEIIMQTDIHHNLLLLPTGKLPLNPSELILNGQAEVLFNYLDSKFDYIVVDTAPIIPVTDAYILSPYCDATLYIIRHGYTLKTFVERIDENNKINHLKNLAIVFNGVSPRGFGNRSYGYGYGYGYVYEDSKDTRKRLPAS